MQDPRPSLRSRTAADPMAVLLVRVRLSAWGAWLLMVPEQACAGPRGRPAPAGGRQRADPPAADPSDRSPSQQPSRPVGDRAVVAPPKAPAGQPRRTDPGAAEKRRRP